MIIYRFTSPGDSTLEVEQFENQVLLRIENFTTTTIKLNESQIYDLIGALYSLKTKIKNNNNFFLTNAS